MNPEMQGESAVGDKHEVLSNAIAKQGHLDEPHLEHRKTEPPLAVHSQSSEPNTKQGGVEDLINETQAEWSLNEMQKVAYEICAEQFVLTLSQESTW